MPARSSSAAGIISAPSRISASIPGGALIAVTGNPGAPLDSDWGFYGIIDQLIWRVPGSEDPKGVGVFGRVMGAPADRNLVDFYADSGVTFTGMIPQSARRRAWPSASPIPASPTGCTAFDVDFGEPVARNYEALIEICYTSDQVPAGRCSPTSNISSSPAATSPASEDATVVGARTSISF